jgi:hypothetical protein
VSPDDVRSIKANLSLQDENWEYNGCLGLIKQFIASKSHHAKDDLEEQIRQAENDNDFNRVAQLLREKNDRAVKYDKLKMESQKRSN